MPPIRTMAKVKPRPIPKPSMIESQSPFFDANASARPRMMQLTTMSGMNMPSDFESSGR